MLFDELFAVDPTGLLDFFFWVFGFYRDVQCKELLAHTYIQKSHLIFAISQAIYYQNHQAIIKNYNPLIPIDNPLTSRLIN